MPTTDIEHKMAMDAIGMAAQVLGPNAERYEALIEAERSMHSSLHITDPTLYRRALADEGLSQQVALCKAAVAFLKVVDQVKTELCAEEPA